MKKYSIKYIYYLLMHVDQSQGIGRIRIELRNVRDTAGAKPHTLARHYDLCGIQNPKN